MPQWDELQQVSHDLPQLHAAVIFLFTLPASAKQKQGLEKPRCTL